MALCHLVPRMIAKNPPSCQWPKSNTPAPGAVSTPPSAAGPRDRARAAWDWECRVDGRAGRRSFPWRNARARQAREANRDQGQPIEIPRFQVRKTGDNRKDRADRQLFPTSAELRDQRDQHVGSLYVPFKGRNSATRPDHPVGKGRWRQAGPTSSRAKGARHPRSERRLGIRPSQERPRTAR
jgi:hypothetical protein